MPYLILLLVILFSAPAWSQNKLDLGDIEIRGEGRAGDQLRLIGRESFDIKNFVKFRTNYRKEMTEELPLPEPKVKY